MIKDLILDEICLNMFVNEIYREYKYEVLDKKKVDISKLEFLGNNDYELVVSYIVKSTLDNNDYELVIVVEKERILYLLLNDNDEVVEEFIIKEVELYDYL